MKYIISNPHILGGVPIIKGTRIPVARIFHLLAQGYNNEEIQKEYPHLTKRKINLVLTFMAETFNRHKDVFME